MYTDYIGSEPRCCFIAKKLVWWVAAVCCTGGAVDATDAVARARAMSPSFISKAQVAQHGDRKPILVSESVVEERPAVVAATPPLRDAVMAPASPFNRDHVMTPAAPSLPVASEAPVAAAPVAEPAPVVVAAPVVEASRVVEPPPVAAAPAVAPADPVVVAIPATEVATAPPVVPIAVAVSPVPVVAERPSAPASPFRLASADPRFEAALTALAINAPVDFKSEEEAIPDAPFAGKRRTKPAEPAPQATKPAEAKPADVTPTIVLPQMTDVLPRPRPPLTPAQELGLEGKERVKAEKCLANAIYFEARNEPVRGQVAVAQVVLNRVFSPYYPGDVCGVVYQNAHRRLACQFTFACDGIPDIVREKGPWSRAQKIAKQALDSQNWLPEVAKATHYHATYVRPRWIRDMRTIVKHGQHIFYRPRNWGNGEDEAGWGVASLTHSTPAKTKTARN
jgi:spore germination cell wall hydrolase CwlJ-like protein